MRKIIYLFVLLLVAFQLRAEDAIDWNPTLPPDPGATFGLTLIDEPNGVAELIGGGIYHSEDEVTINCIVPEGYKFLHWKYLGEVFATTAQHTFKMPEQNMVLIAHLVKWEKQPLILKAEPVNAATFIGEGEYYPGTTVHISCVENEDYTFNYWTLNGEKYSDSKDIVYTTTGSNDNLVAVCSYTPTTVISIEPNAPEGGEVSSTGGIYSAGDNITFTATAKQDFLFSHWEMNGAFYSNQATINYTVGTEDAHFVAIFDYAPMHPDDPSMELKTTIYIESNPAGAATFNIPSGSEYYEGDTLIISATLKSNYVLDGWYINNTCIATTKEFMYIVGYENVTIVLKAKEIINRQLTLLSFPDGAVQFNIAKQTTVQVDEEVNLHAFVLPSYTFKGWYEGDMLLSNQLSFTYLMPNRNVTITAMAEPIQTEDWNPILPADPDMESVNIIVETADATTGKTTGTGLYAVGEVITIQAIPYPGYHFTQWSDGNTEPIREVEVIEETMYIAQFNPNNYNLLVESNDELKGTTSGSGIYPYLTNVTINATANSGYKFEQWSDGNKSEQRTVLVCSDTLFTAIFTAITIKLNVLTSSIEAGSVSGDGWYLHGESVTISATPNEGYNFVQWSDGNTDPIRTVVVAATNPDYIAYFTSSEAINEQYTRDVTTGMYGTICLPYASNNYSGAEFYEVSSLEIGRGLWLDELEKGAALESGKPYIFKATMNKITVHYEGRAVSSPKEGAKGLTGTFVNIDAGTNLVGHYIIAENKVWIANTNNTLPAYRAYINANLVPTTPQAQIPGRRRVCMGATDENQTTDLFPLETTDNQCVKMIINNQLVIVRNGEIYNIQGQKIKNK